MSIHNDIRMVNTLIHNSVKKQNKNTYTIDLKNEELKAKVNEQPTLTPIIMSTHTLKTQNKNMPQLN